MLAGRISVNVKLARWRKAQRSTGSTTAQNGMKSEREIPEAFRKLERKVRASKKEWQSIGKEDSQRCTQELEYMPAEGFKDHVATDGSLLGSAEKMESMWLGSGAVGL